VIVVDVNVLVAAYLTRQTMHTTARAWLAELLSTGEVAVPDVVWSGFSRIVTNPSITNPPATWSDVRSFIAAVQRHPSYREDIRGMLAPLGSFAILCQETKAVGNKVSDAYIAAIAIDHNAGLASWDSDFSAFPVTLVKPPALPGP